MHHRDCEDTKTDPASIGQLDIATSTAATRRQYQNARRTVRHQVVSNKLWLARARNDICSTETRQRGPRCFGLLAHRAVYKKQIAWTAQDLPELDISLNKLCWQL